MARRDRQQARDRPTKGIIERAAIALPTAIALIAAVAAAFVGKLRRRRPDATDDAAADRSPLPAQDRAQLPPFDPKAAGAQGTRNPKGIVLRFAERHHWRWLGRTLQVLQRYQELHGGEIASAVTLMAFLTLFPLLLVAIAVLGFIQANSDDFAARVVENLGLHGEAARQVTTTLETASQSKRATSIVGLLGLLWAGLGFTAALRVAFNRVWQVEARPGWKDRALGLMWFAGAGVIFAAGTAVTAALNWLPGPVTVLGVFVSLLLSFAFFLWTSRVLPNLDVGWRALLPGAIVGAVGLEVLKYLGAILVPRAVASASALYGTLGVVFALLAWLLFFGKLVVYAAVIDVVVFEGNRGTVVSTVEVPAHEAATREVTRSGTSKPEADAARPPETVSNGASEPPRPPEPDVAGSSRARG